MSVTEKEIGGGIVCYTLDNEKGLSAEILNYGGIIKNLLVTDRSGKKVDVVLGRDGDYKSNNGYLGAAIGRHANRIQNSVFYIEGKEYKVGTNEGKNSLHGGVTGFDKKIWNAEVIDGEEPSLIMTIVSPDDEEGFPGNLKVKMTYILTKENSLKIEYFAESDKDTVVNLTNHSYFNLAGHDSGNIYNQILQINSEFYTPNCKECMPTGEVLSVCGTPFDFRVPKPIGQDISADFEQIQMFGGFDHNYAISGEGYRKAACAECTENGITMEVYTNQPAMQLYTSNGLEEGKYKNGAEYKKHQAFCLETQCFPNAMKHRHYPGPLLRAGSVYNTVTEYKFIVK